MLCTGSNVNEVTQKRMTKQNGTFTLTLSVPNFRLHLSSALFLTNYRLERRLYVHSKDPNVKQRKCKTIIIVCGSERRINEEELHQRNRRGTVNRKSVGKGRTVLLAQIFVSLIALYIIRAMCRLRIP